MEIDYGGFGPSDFERREELGLPNWGYGLDDHIWVEARVSRYPEWRVRAGFFLDGEGLVLQSIAIQPVSNYPAVRPGLTATILRAVSTPQLCRQARDALKLDHHEVIQRIDSDPRSGKGFRSVPRPGRRGRSDRQYAEIVAKLVAQMRRNPRAPRMALAQELGLTPSQLTNILTEARRRKILDGTERGKAGGKLTEYGRRVLAADGQPANPAER